jgi:hypothetical protein
LKGTEQNSMNNEQTAHRSALVGTWTLISFEGQAGQGPVVYPYGADAQGILIYADNGRYAVQIMNRARPPLAAGDQMKGTPQEIRAAFEGCLAYYGSYEYDPAAGWVLHHVEASLYPNWNGVTLKRYAELEGDRLKLTTPSMPWGGSENFVGCLVWERS